MEYVQRNLGVHTADAEGVRLNFDGDLVLSFRDWRQQPREMTFRDVLAFRWQELEDVAVPRPDETYEVVESEWLSRQAALQGVAARDFAHYTLCFNASGVLDVLCRRINPSEGSRS